VGCNGKVVQKRMKHRNEMRIGLAFVVIACLGVGLLHAQGPVLGEGYSFPRVNKTNVDVRMAHKGQVEEGLTWKDEGGENTLLLCYDRNEREQNRDIYLYQYRVAGGKCSLVWDIQDFGSALCEMTFIPNSLQLIDLDKDGILEACFMYQNVCDGLDPRVTKMMLLKNGEKLAIRGKFSVEEQEEVEKTIDPAVAKHPPIFKNFMLMNWEEFKGEGIQYAKSVRFWADGYLVLQKEYLDASGGTEYALLDMNGLPMDLAKEMQQKIQGPEDLELMPDRKTLLYVDVSGVGTYDPISRKETVFMTFLEGTEAVSAVAWSPDRKRCAFTALNGAQYPQRTRVFVLRLEGNAMVGKEKFDARLMHMAASDWVVEAPRFRDDVTVEYVEMEMEYEGPREGAVRTIGLK
jgi:hypothetical protein